MLAIGAVVQRAAGGGGGDVETAIHERRIAFGQDRDLRHRHIHAVHAMNLFGAIGAEYNVPCAIGRQHQRLAARQRAAARLGDLAHDEAVCEVCSNGDPDLNSLIELGPRP